MKQSDQWLPSALGQKCIKALSQRYAVLNQGTRSIHCAAPVQQQGYLDVRGLGFRVDTPPS